MIRRLAFILIVVGCLAGLIAYSQLRPVPQRVSGFIEADEIRVGSRVGGRVAKVHVEEGQEVKEGQLLVEFEPFDLLARETEAARSLAAREADYQRLAKGLRAEEIAQAKARRDQLQARLDLAEAGPREQEIDAARGRVEAAKAEHKLAKQTFDRHAQLIQNEAISREEFDRTSEAFDAAQAMLVVRQKELELLEVGTRDEEKREARAAVEEATQAWQMATKGFRQEEVDQAKAARDAAQATLDAIRRQMEELAITSPLQGVVDSLDLQPGDMVAAGAPTLSIVDHRHLWVRAYVPQNRVRLQVGQQLRVTVDSFPERSFIGKISFISRQAEFTPSNVQTPEERSKQVYRIKVKLEDDIDQLRPGMTTDVWLDLNGETE